MKQLTLNFQNDLEPAGEMTTSSLPAGSRSRASRFQPQASEKAQPITVTSGRKCCESFGKFVPDGSWAKTFSELLIGTEDWFSSRCTLTWKLRGTKSRRLYFQLVASAPRTSDTEHGSLPMLLKTPSAMDARSENLTKKEQKFGNSGTLAQEVHTGFIYKRGLLPTPRTTDIGRGTAKDVKFENGTYFRENKKGVRFGVNITDVIASGLLPTPTANDGKNATLPESQKERTSLVAEAMKYKTDGQTSQLNPLFIQEMMGLPYLWTELPFQSGGQSPSKLTETR